MMAGSTLHRIVVITVGLVLMVVLHLVVAICCVLFRARPSSRRVAEHAEEESGGGAGGLSAEEVGQLPCHEFKEGAGGGGDCAVCLDVFRSGDRCRVMPRCGHGFHAECLDSWLRKSRRCPVCRTEVVEQQQKDATGAAAATVEIVTQE